MARVYVGTAGWGLPKAKQGAFHYSAYGPERLAPWHERAARAARQAEAVFFILDNTAAFEATTDALTTQQVFAFSSPGALPATFGRQAAENQ